MDKRKALAVKYPFKMRRPDKVNPDPTKNRKFKRDLLKAGYLSPHFTLAEAKCKDGTGVPGELLGNAQRQAFTLEKVRYDIGKPIALASWYRTPSHNRSVGGATNSQHVRAAATDIDREAMAARGVNMEKFDQSVSKHFAGGGIGVDGGTNDVEHCDTRGSAARWTY